mmetsp:Transcript_49718/g.137811  ORF Transcript_49718/g.137811 Transcript_49718/m.137811 type:complete len:85 (+) Transcript_49718:159-413(+)
MLSADDEATWPQRRRVPMHRRLQQLNRLPSPAGAGPTPFGSLSPAGAALGCGARSRDVLRGRVRKTAVSTFGDDAVATGGGGCL